MKLLAALTFAISFLFPGSAPAFDINATSAATEEKVSWHGYYEFEYWDIENRNNSFDAHKITLWMGVKLHEKVYLSAEIEYEHGPNLSDESKPGGKGKIQLDSASLRITPFDNTTIYTGVFYAPFGIEYFSYPGHKNKLVTRPKVMKGGGVIPGTWSDVGIGAKQLIDGFGEIDVYYVNGDAHNGGVNRDNKDGGNDGKSLGARVMLNKLAEGANFGFSYIEGKWDENNQFDSRRTGAHISVDLSSMTGVGMAPAIIAEYVSGKDEGASSGADKNVEGYYVQISSLLYPAVEVAIRYGKYDNDTDITDNQMSETSIGVVWHIYDFLQFKAEYQINEEQSADIDNNVAVAQLVANW